MRKINRRDVLALLVPAIVLAIIVYSVQRDRGWYAAIVSGVLFAALILGYWIYRIRKYPDHTWRARLYRLHRAKIAVGSTSPLASSRTPSSPHSTLPPKSAKCWLSSSPIASADMRIA